MGRDSGFLLPMPRGDELENKGREADSTFSSLPELKQQGSKTGRQCPFSATGQQEEEIR